MLAGDARSHGRVSLTSVASAGAGAATCTSHSSRDPRGREARYRMSAARRDVARHRRSNTPCIEALEERRLMAITLSASVGEGGVNRASDVRQVQQRLRDLNFRARGGSLLVVDGLIGPATISCIKLYQASIDAEGDGDPDLKDGRVDPGGYTHAWLNATNSPRWAKLVDPDGAGGAFDIYRGTAQEEVWGT